MNQQSDGRYQTIADELLSAALFLPAMLPTRGDDEMLTPRLHAGLQSGLQSSHAVGLEPSLQPPLSSALPLPPARLAGRRVRIREVLTSAIANITRAIETSSRGELETVSELFCNETREQLEKAKMKRTNELDIEDTTAPFCTVCQGECIEGAMVIMSCGHFFHACCALQHMVSSGFSLRAKRCPLCAAPWDDPHGITYLDSSHGITLTACNDIISKRAEKSQNI